MTISAKAQSILDGISDLQAQLLELNEISYEEYKVFMVAMDETVAIIKDGVDQEKMKAEQKAQAAERLKASTAKRKELLDKLRPYKNANPAIKLTGTMQELELLLQHLTDTQAPQADAPPKVERKVEMSFRELQAELKAMGYKGPRAGKGVTREVLEDAYLKLKAEPKAPKAEPAKPEVVAVVPKAPKAEAPKAEPIAVKLSQAREQGLTEATPKRRTRKGARRIK